MPWTAQSRHRRSATVARERNGRSTCRARGASGKPGSKSCDALPISGGNELRLALAHSWGHSLHFACNELPIVYSLPACLQPKPPPILTRRPTPKKAGQDNSSASPAAIPSTESRWDPPEGLARSAAASPITAVPARPLSARPSDNMQSARHAGERKKDQTVISPSSPHHVPVFTHFSRITFHATFSPTSIPSRGNPAQLSRLDGQRRG